MRKIVRVLQIFTSFQLVIYIQFVSSFCQGIFSKKFGQSKSFDLNNFVLRMFTEDDARLIIWAPFGQMSVRREQFLLNN